MMLRAYVPPEWQQEKTLPKDISHHLVNVLRLKQGDIFEGFDGKGHKSKWEILELTKKGAIIKKRGDTLFSPQGIRFELILGATKTDTIDKILRQSTEMGVTTIRLVLMKRSVVPFKALTSKKERFYKILREACAQSRRDWIPEILFYKNLNATIEDVKDIEKKILFWEKSNNINILYDHRPLSTAVLIGPEGGIEYNEVQTILNHSFEEYSLGPTILRSDTAVVAGLALSRPFKQT